MAGEPGPVAAGQQPEAVGQPLRDVGDGEHAEPGGGQLDGQRQAVEAADDLDDGTDRLLVQDEAGRDGGGPVDEQADGGVRGRGPRVGVRRREGQRGERGEDLAVDGQRLAAGRQHPDVGDLAQDLVDQPGRGVDQVLAVVDHEQAATPVQRADEPLGGVLRAAVGSVGHPGVPQPQGRERRVGHAAGLRDRRQLDQPRGTVARVEPAGRGLHREAGLPRAARPDDRHEPARPQGAEHPLQVGLAPDEAGPAQRQVVVPGGGAHDRVRLDLAAQQPQVQGGELGPRVGAQLVGEDPAGVLVRGQRLGAPPGRGERAQEEQPEAFVEGVLGDQRRQLVDDRRRPRPTGSAHSARPRAAARRSAAQRSTRARRVRRVPGVDERLPTPQRERGGVRLGRGREVARLPRRVAAVDLDAAAAASTSAASTHQPVAPRLLDDQPGGAERAPQPGDQRLQGVGRLGGRRVAPDRLDELVGADRASGVDREPAQQRPQPRPLGVTSTPSRSTRNGPSSPTCTPPPSSPR